jgi:hypothetical protein
MATKDEIRAAMVGLSPDQQKQFMSEVERRMGAQAQGAVPQTHALPTDEQIQSFVEPPAPTHPLAQLGAGVQNQFAKWALGARQGLDQAIANNGEPRPSGSIGSMLESVGLLRKPQDVQYDPGDYAQIRKQLEPRSTLESVGQLGTSVAGAAALGGGAGGVTLGTGLATELETGDPKLGAKVALGSAVLGPVTAKLGQYGAGLKWSQAKMLAKALKIGAGFVGGEMAGGGYKSGIGGAMLAAILPGVPSSSKRKIYDYVRNDQINEAARLLWKYLPPLVGHAAADTETVPGPDTPGFTDQVSTTDMLAEAKRRKAANAVLR